jgi:hypothetical protein
MRCHTGALLHTLPAAPSALQLQLHQCLPVVLILTAQQCGCGWHMQRSDNDHSMPCNRLSRSQTAHQGHCKAVVSCHTVQAYPCSSNQASINANPNSLCDHPDNRALIPPPYGMTLPYAIVIHPRQAMCVQQAAQELDATADKRDHDKPRGINGLALKGQTHVLAFIRTDGYLGKPLAQLLSQHSEAIPQQTLGLVMGSISGPAYGDLSTPLLRGKGHVKCAEQLTRASGSECFEGCRTACIDWVLLAVCYLIDRFLTLALILALLWSLL